MSNLVIQYVNMVHIALATDLSEHAQHAAMYAVHLFGTSGTYHLVHAHMDMPVDNALLPPIGHDLLEAHRDGLRRFAERFISASGAKNVEQEVHYGSVLGGLNDLDGIDFVVMGRRGEGGAVLFGTNATEVAKHCSFPVLLVPARSPLKRIHRILLACDHEEISPEDLAPLKEIAHQQGARVEIVYVTDHIPSDAPQWDRGLIELGLKDVPYAFHEALSNDVVEGLGRAATKWQADMIAVLHRRPNLIEGVFHRSITKHLVQESELPLLVLRHS